MTRKAMGRDPLAERATGLNALIRDTTGSKTKDNSRPKPPRKKEMIRVAYSIDKDLIDKLKYLAVYKRMELSTLVSTAIKDMIDRENIEVHIKAKGPKT